jgi:hypothetical protein
VAPMAEPLKDHETRLSRAEDQLTLAQEAFRLGPTTQTGAEYLSALREFNAALLEEAERTVRAQIAAIAEASDA